MLGVTFCLGFRDWYPSHLDRCLRTIRAGAGEAPIIVCDLGSDEVSMPTVRYAVSEVGGRLLSHVEPEWSRSRALNLAAAAAPEAHWYCFTDADMLFPPSWFGAAASELMQRGHAWRLFLTRARDLDEAGTEEVHDRPIEFLWSLGSPSIMSGEEWLFRRTSPHPAVGQGAAMLIPGPWFREVGGFDEAYKVWGAEDNDLVLRAQWDDHPVEWLRQSDGTFAWVAHQWHRRDWPTPAQIEQVHRNRAYLAERMVERGPIVRNR